MKKILLFLLPLAVLAGCSQAPQSAFADKEVEARVEKVLKKMTLEEKIGQMVQINVTMVSTPDGSAISENGRKVLCDYKVGSILNTVGDNGAVSAEVYRNLIKQIQDLSIETTGIPCIYGLDQIHGATYTVGGTFFPQEINLGATFNTEFASQMGEILAYETRACNVPWVFSPVMDLARHQAWPRLWESFGEDVTLNRKMAVAEVLGQQGSDPNHIDEYHVGSSLKHFMAYGAAVSGQDRTPSSVSRRDLKEKYFQPFRACCEAGAISIMVNSANNDGIPFHCNRELLTEWVKEGLNWDGFFVTDWADVKNLYNRDHVAVSEKDAARLAVNAGIDMIMDPYTCDVCDHIKALVEEGEIPMSRINDAARRVIRAKVRLGLFDDPYGEKGTYEKFACEEYAQVAYRAAVESEVLLKNEGILPLSKNTRILLVGPNANSMRTLNGGWSYSWQGDRGNEEALTGQYNTIYEALQNKFAKVTYIPCVEYTNEWNWQAEKVSSFAAARAAALFSDVIICCIGENTYCETPGNIVDLNLSNNQKELVKAMAATGKPVIFVLSEGRPRIISDIEPLANAVVDIMLPSNYGADALAALLCGEENFSGKLPFTYPKYPNRLGTYDYLLCENQATMAGTYNYDAKMDMQWFFGDGLSYTTYEYSNMTVDKTDFKAGDVLKVSVDISNTGKMAGKESVLLFSSDIYASVCPDVRRLRDFTKISLEPGQTKTVSFELKADDLAFVNHDLEWTLEPGEFRLAIGNQSVTVNCVK